MPSLLYLLARPWFIDPATAASYAPLISGALGGAPSALDWGEDQEQEQATTTTKRVAVMSIKGPLTKDDKFCGPVGMDTIAERINQLNADGSISAIVLKIDSPGGTVDGTANLASTIANSHKPVVAYVDGTAASGAYWIASHCQRIIAANDTVRLGSIGVMTSFVDMQPHFETLGYKFHEVYSRLSPKKNEDVNLMVQGKYDQYQTNVLDPLAKMFIEAVKSKRNITDASIFEGRTVFAREAIANGMIDAFGSLDDAVNQAIELATPNNNEYMINKFENLESALGTAIEQQDGGSFLNVEQLQQLDAQLQSISEASTTATRIAQLETDLATSHQQVAELNAQITALRSNPAEPSATEQATLPATEATSTQADDFHTRFAACNGDTQAELAVLREFGF